MNFFKNRNSKGKTENGSSKPKTASGGEAKAAVRSAAPPSKKDGNNDRGNNKEPQNKDRKPTKRAQKTQSALRPGHESGLKTKKGHDNFVQFGPIISEFNRSNALVNKHVTIDYDVKLDKLDVKFTFSAILANGVSIDKPKTLSLDDYMAQRFEILKKVNEASLFVSFAETLIDRLGIDVTDAKPSVRLDSVQKFILKHMSPVERVIVQLKDDEYAVLDTAKIPGLLAPTNKVVDEVYGGMSKRTDFLVEQINATAPTADKAPPNWIEYGVIGISKGVLLENLKIRKKAELDGDQKNSLATLRAALDMMEGEEEKSPEDKVEKE